MRAVIAALCLIAIQMQICTAISEDASKSLMVQYEKPNYIIFSVQSQNLAFLYKVSYFTCTCIQLQYMS